MKKTVSFSLLLSMFFLGSFAQTKEELAGTWTVTKVTVSYSLPGLTEKETEEGRKKMEKEFMNSTIQLNADGKSKVEILEKMTKEAGMKTINTTWVYNEIDKSVLIHEGAGKNKDIMMKFYVKKEGRKWAFVVDEVGIMLDVKKNK